MANTKYIVTDDDITPMFLGEREKVHSQQRSGIDMLREEIRLEEEAAIDAQRPEGGLGRVAGAAWQEFKHTPVNFAASARSYLEEELGRIDDGVDMREEDDPSFEGIRFLRREEDIGKEDYEGPVLGADIKISESRKNIEELIGITKEVEEAEAFKKDPEYEGLSSGFFEDVARGITGSLPDMALTIVTPPVGMAAMFAHIQGASYSEMQEKVRENFPEMTEREVNKRALTASSVNAAVQTPLELIGNLIKIKGVFGKSGFAKRIGALAESAFGEGITEYVQQFPEEFAMIWAMNPDLTRKEFFAFIKEQGPEIRKRARYAGYVGAAAGSTTTGLGAAGVKVYTKYISPIQKKINDKRNKKFADKIDKGELITEEDITPTAEEREKYHKLIINDLVEKMLDPNVKLTKEEIEEKRYYKEEIETALDDRGFLTKEKFLKSEEDIALRLEEEALEEEAAALDQFEDEFGEGETVDSMLKEKLTREGHDLALDDDTLQHGSGKVKEAAAAARKLIKEQEGTDTISEEVLGKDAEEAEQRLDQPAVDKIITDKIREQQELAQEKKDIEEDKAVAEGSVIVDEDTHKAMLEERKKVIKELDTGPEAVEKASSVEEMKQVEEQTIDEVAKDEEFQGTTVSEIEQLNSLADDLNINREDFRNTMNNVLTKRKPGDPVNRNMIEAFIRIHTASAFNVKKRAKDYLDALEKKDSSGLVSPFNISIAEERFLMSVRKHDHLTSQLKDAGTTSGEALKAMDTGEYTYREANAQMRRDYLNRKTHRLATDITTDRLAKDIASLETPFQINHYSDKIKRIGIGDMLLEVWISALLSNPTTHAVNFTTNLLVDIFAIPERYMGSLSSIIRRGHYKGQPKEFKDTKNPDQMSVEEGEAMELAYGLMEGLRDAMVVMREGVSEYTKDEGFGIDIEKIAAKIRNESQVRIDYLNHSIYELNNVRKDKGDKARKDYKKGITRVKRLALNEIDVEKTRRKDEELAIDLELKANLKSIKSSNLSVEDKASKTKEVNRIAKDKKRNIMKDSNEKLTKIRTKRKRYTDQADRRKNEELASIDNEIKDLETEKLELERTEGLRGSDNTKLERMRHKTISAKGLRDVKGGLHDYFSSNPLPISYYNMSENPADWIEKGFNWLGFMVRAPSSMLLVSDKVFKNAIGYRMNLRALAYRTAMQEGRVGEEQATRMNEIMKDPKEHAPKVLQEAQDQAAYQVFVNKLGKFGNNFEKAIGGSKVAKVIVPFLRTPVNILKYGLQRTPLMLFEKNFWADLKAGGSRADMAIGKVAAGSTLALIFAGFALTGQITGSGPPDADLRNLKRNSGWQPYSFRFKNTYYSYSRLEPFGMLLGALADGVDLMGEANPDDSKRIAMTLAYSLANNVTSKTWCRSAAEFVNVLSNENRYSATYVHKILSSFVPFSSGLSQAKKVGIPGFVEADKKLRDIRIRDRENTFMMEHVYKTYDTFQSRIPGLSRNLKPRLNLWGEEITLGGGLGPEFISPIYSNEVKYSPVDEEMYRLGIDGDHHFKMPEATIDIQGVSVELTGEEYHHFLKTMNTIGVLDKGLTLKESIAREVELFDKYDYPNEVRFNIISGMMESARAIAKENLYDSFTDLKSYVNTKQGEREDKTMSTLNREKQLRRKRKTRGWKKK